MRALVDLTPFRDYLASGYVLLTPGRRLARALVDAVINERMEAGMPAECPPPVFTIDGWLESLWREQVELGSLPPYRLLDRVGERLLWQQIIASDLKSQGSFTLIQVSGAAEQAARARQQWLMSGGNSRDAAQRSYFGFEVDCAAFGRWCQAFDKELEQLACYTRADVYRALLELPVDKKSPVVLCHVLDLPALTRQVLCHVADVEAPQAATSEGFTPVAATCFDNRREELSRVAAWAADRHRRDQGSTAIVLLDFQRDRQQLDYFLRQQFDCLGARYAALPVNFSTGMPLADTPLFRDALLALRLSVPEASAPLSRSELLALLRSPFLSGDDDTDGPAVLRLRHALTEMMSDTLDRRDVGHLVKTHAPESHFGRVLDALLSNRDTRQRCSPSDWLTVVRQQLQLWGWPGARPLDSLEYQQFERLESTFDDVMRLDLVAGPVSFSAFISLWESVLKDRIFQPKTPDTAVQVLGPQEVVGLRFDAVWICSVQSDALPAPVRIQPFLPLRLQRDLGMPDGDPAALDLRAKQLLNSLRQTHASVLLSCVLEQDGVDVLPSPLIETAAADSPSSEQPIPEHWPAASHLESVHEGRVATDGEAIRFGGGAAVITHQSNCPFRAWIVHRIGPEAVAPTAFGLTAAERGTVVHDALGYLWNQLGDSAALQAMDTAQCEVLVRTAVEDAVGQLESRARRRQRSVRKRVGSACLDLEAERVTVLLTDWLELESTREGAFTVIEQEDSHQLKVGPLTLTLRPDRIDRLPDGRHLVIDYKTGAVKRANWLGERPVEPQLPLYALLDERVAGLAYGRAHQDGVAYVFLGEDLGLTQKDVPLEMQTRGYEVDLPASWEDLRGRWRTRLDALAEDYAQGEAAIDPLPQACRYCSLGSVCRFAETREFEDDIQEYGVGGLS